MELTKKYQVLISEETKHGNFRDALYFDKLPDDKEIEIEAQERIDNWVYSIENPPEPVELTKEEIEKAIIDLENQKVSIDTQKLNYQTLLTAKG